MKSYFVVPTSSSERESRKSGLIPLSKDELHATASLGPTLSIALDFFTTAFVWFDAISCITTGLRPSCPEWLSCLLLEEDGRFQLCKLMGCRNWAIVMVLKIAALEVWKTECQCNGILNVRELAGRAASIEKELEYELAANTKAVSKDWKTQAVTNIFGCSALTYLHVVRFGAYPELPKIRDSVLRTLEAFQALPTVHWTRTLVLPFFIAGCMTMPQDERKFKEIACTASSQRLANFAIATKVVQDCWAVRRESEEPCFRGVDWKTAMKRLGTDVLLI
jgi:C6 transcription factor Pro1